MYTPNSYTVLSFLRKFNLKITERLLASLVPYQAKTVSSKQISFCLSHFPALLVSLMPDCGAIPFWPFVEFPCLTFVSWEPGGLVG